MIFKASYNPNSFGSIEGIGPEALVVNGLDLTEGEISLLRLLLKQGQTLVAHQGSDGSYDLTYGGVEYDNPMDSIADYEAQEILAELRLLLQPKLGENVDIEINILVGPVDYETEHDFN